MDKIKISEIENLLKEGKTVHVKSFNGNFEKVSGFINKGMLDTYSVALENQKNIKVTKDHKFFTNAGWVACKDLLIGKHSLLCDDDSYSAVKSVTFIGLRKIVDISVDSTHAYFGNGIMNHNTGKSLLAQLICAAAQKQGAMVMYEDFEGTIDSSWCKTVGLDVNKNFIYAQPNHLEEGFEMIFTTLHMIDEVEKQGKEPFPFTVIVVDSVAGAPVSADLETENVDPGANMGLKARIISKNITNLRGAAGRKNVLLIFLNQLKEKIGAMGYTDEAKYSTPGGKAIRYFSSASMQISSVGKIKNKDNEIVGIKTSVKILKNRFGPGFRIADFPIFFNRGIDDAISCLEFLSEGNGIIKANNGPKGATYHFKGDDKETGLTQADWVKAFKNDTSFRTRVDDLLEKLLVKHPESKEGEEVSIEAGSEEV